MANARARVFVVVAVAALAGCGSSGSGNDAAAGGTDGGGGGAGGAVTDGRANDAGGMDGIGGAPVTSDLGPHCTGCTRTTIGSPIWEPTNAVVVVGMVGSGTTALATFTAWLNGFAAPNHRYYMRESMLGPARAHAAPYDDEAYTMAMASNLTPKQTLTTAEYTAPSGVFVLINGVPSGGAPTAGSPDFTSGPVVPNALFPINVMGQISREGGLYEASQSYLYGNDQFQPQLIGDPSHFFFFFAENSSFVPSAPAQGSYSIDYDAVDFTGSGWKLHIPFTVGP